MNEILLNIAFFFSFTTYCIGNNKPVVVTKLGIVQGIHRRSFKDQIFSAFEGIPYAKPPVGDLRFKEPQSIEPWIGIWDATSLYKCMQLPDSTGDVEGDEDCLYMNVYVPRKRPNASDSLDVILYIHGGGFKMGSPYPHTKPTFLMDREIIFVTFNYRLGILGFLSTEDENVPGNNGLKDQREALKWIQNNIKNFGGNPNSVTLAGFSSGAMSVHLHYLSSSSKGLFHRGISQSGTSLNPRALQKAALRKTKIIAASVGCDVGVKNLIECLKQRPAKTLVKNTKFLYGYSFFPFGIFGPVIEKPSKGSFLTEHPYKLLQGGNVNDMPFLFTMSSDEGIFPVAKLEDHLNDIDKDWEQAAPYMLEFNDTATFGQKSNISHAIKQFYFGNESISNINVENLVKLFTHRYYATGIETAVRMQADLKKSLVYFLYFQYRGVGHGDQNIYLYDTLNLSNSMTKSDQEIIDIFLQMYTTFAKTNKPEVNDIKWEPVTDKFTFLSIKSPNQILVEDAENLSPTEFWNSLPLDENGNIFRVN